MPSWLCPLACPLGGLGSGPPTQWGLFSGQVLGQAKVDQPLKVEVVFTNPLNEEVKDCVLQAEGSDLLAEKLKLE